MSSSSGISSSSLSNSSFYHRERGGAAGEAASASSIKLLDEILEEDNSSFDGGGRSRYDHKYFYDTHLLHFLPNVEDIVLSHPYYVYSSLQALCQERRLKTRGYLFDTK